MRVPIINKARGAWVMARATRVARVACAASKKKNFWRPCYTLLPRKTSSKDQG